MTLSDPVFIASYFVKPDYPILAFIALIFSWPVCVARVIRYILAY